MSIVKLLRHVSKLVFSELPPTCPWQPLAEQPARPIMCGACFSGATMATEIGSVFGAGNGVAGFCESTHVTPHDKTSAIPANNRQTRDIIRDTVREVCGSIIWGDTEYHCERARTLQVPSAVFATDFRQVRLYYRNRSIFTKRCGQFVDKRVGNLIASLVAAHIILILVDGRRNYV